MVARMTVKRLPVILDGDPGHDDAIAWVVAGVQDELNILAVTSVSGNQTIEKTTLNASKILTLIGRRLPLAKGAVRPLFAEPMTAPAVHGQTGLDGPELPEPQVPVLDLPAVDLMAETIFSHAEPVTIIATGPLTNVALLLLTYPEIKEKIAAIYFMGGGIRHGNWTPSAEFNILVDPEAADIVFRSGLPLVMCGLDVTETALIMPHEFEEIEALGNEVATIVAAWLRFFYEFHKEKGYTGAPLHDAVAIAALVTPELLTFRDLSVEVELTGDYSRGATVADWYGLFGKEKNIKVALEIDREGFFSWLKTHISKYGEAPNEAI